MKWLISVAVAVAMVLGGVAMASPALALELPDPTLLEVPDGRHNAPVFPSDDLDDIDIDITTPQHDIIVQPTTPGDVELPDFTLPDQCGQDNAPVFASDDGQDIVDDGQDIVDDDSVDRGDDQTVDTGAVMTAS